MSPLETGCAFDVPVERKNLFLTLQRGLYTIRKPSCRIEQENTCGSSTSVDRDVNLNVKIQRILLPRKLKTITQSIHRPSNLN